VGQFIAFTNTGSESAHQYWHPIPPDDVPWLPTDQVLEEFEPALERAVARCLQLDPHGIMLSGGLDSVTIAGIAHAQRRAAGLPPITAVCGRTGRRLSYEEVMQSRVAEELGMPQAISTTSEWLAGRDAIDLSLEMTPTLPAPGRIWWVGTYTGFYRRTAAAGLNSLLTGAGGDNWLGVANTHAADLLRRGRLGELSGFIRSDVRTAGLSWGTALHRRLWAGGVRTLLDSGAAVIAPGVKARFHAAQWARHWPEWLCPDRELRQEVMERLAGRRTPSLDDRGKFPRNYYRHSLRTVHSPYMHHETETGFHVASACGLRLLSPYHDRRIVSFMNRIAPETLLHGGKYKGLLRPVARKYFPRFELEKQRKEYAAGDQQQAVADFRTSLMRIWPTVPTSPLFDMGVLGGRVNGVVPGEHSSTNDLAIAYAILSASRWAGHHLG
jgi:asparagine synthetase B (glutamine-hydrolysing)